MANGRQRNGSMLDDPKAKLVLAKVSAMNKGRTYQLLTNPYLFPPQLCLSAAVDFVADRNYRVAPKN